MAKTYELTYKGKIHVNADNMNQALEGARVMFKEKDLVQNLRLVSIVELIERD
jgi:hypothetical protein